jgi:hypothetical protein
LKQADRYSRQRILAEIGDAGQTRLVEASFRADEGLSPWAQALSKRYALACGFGHASSDPRSPSVSESLVFFRHTASAEVGLAAFCVLSQSLPLLERPSPNE